MRKFAMLLAAMLARGMIVGAALAADAVKDQSILDRLYANTGVYHRPATAHTPNFVSDPGWPAPLPHNWQLGQIGGLYVDPKTDHIWVYNRPRTMTNDEAALEVRGGGNGKNGLGFGWRNIWVGKFGASYEINDNWIVRAGYSKSEGVIPSTQALFNILAPATVTQHYTMGFTRKLSKASALDFSFMWAPNERVHGTNPNTGPQTGYLELEQYEAELNWTYRF